MALTDALDNLIAFRLPPGYLLANRAFDANSPRQALSEAKIEAAIPPKLNRRFPAKFDRETCKWRHLFEKNFQKNKQIQRHRHALLQNGHQLRRSHRPCRYRHPIEINVNTPWPKPQKFI